MMFDEGIKNEWNETCKKIKKIMHDKGIQSIKIVPNVSSEEDNKNNTYEEHCNNCLGKEYKIEIEQREREFDREKYSFPLKVARCKECGCLISVQKIEEENNEIMKRIIQRRMGA